MTQTRHQLIHLAQAYFHQDYDLEAPTPLDVLRSFQEGESPGAVAELISDIESMLASSMNEGEMRDLWIKEYGASYDPLTDGMEYRRWFADILRVLRAT